MNDAMAMTRIDAAGATLEFQWTPAPAGAAGPAAGDARPAIVLLHDGLGCAATWRGFPAALARVTGCPVLNFSRRGYAGSSPVRGPRAKTYLHEEGEIFLPALLEAIGVRRPILFGHSDGASIAVIFAGAFADRVASVVLEAPHVFVEDITRRGVAAATAAYGPALRARLARHHADPDDVFRRWSDIWRAESFRDWNIEDHAARITAPVLMIQGEDDEYGTRAQLDAIKRGRADRKIVMLENCGHAPHREQEAEVLKVLEEWVGLLPQRLRE